MILLIFDNVVDTYPLSRLSAEDKADGVDSGRRFKKGCCEQPQLSITREGCPIPPVGVLVVDNALRAGRLGA